MAKKEKTKKEPNHVPYMVMAIIGIAISLICGPLFMILGTKKTDTNEILAGLFALLFLIAQPLVGVGVAKWIINSIQEKKVKKTETTNTSVEAVKANEKVDTFHKK